MCFISYFFAKQNYKKKRNYPIIKVKIDHSASKMVDS